MIANKLQRAHHSRALRAAFSLGPSKIQSYFFFFLFMYLRDKREKILNRREISRRVGAIGPADRGCAQLRHVDPRGSMISALSIHSSADGSRRRMTPQPPNGNEPRVGEGNIVSRTGDVAHLFPNTLQSGSKGIANRCLASNGQRDPCGVRTNRVVRD